MDTGICFSDAVSWFKFEDKIAFFPLGIFKLMFL